MDFADNNTFGGATAGAGNLISGNGQNGIQILRSNHSIVQGNFIGTNAAGTGAIGNGLDGVDIDTFRAPYYGISSGTLVGGTAAGARNVISGNGGDGVDLLATGYNYSNPQTPDTLVQGNYIGTNAAGMAALANGHAGVYAAPAVPGVPMSLLIGGGAAGAGNLISGNAEYGVFFLNIYGTIQGNRIGTNAAGVAAVPNLDGVFILFAGAQLGGTAPGEGNLISGNTESGVIFSNAGADVIQGNLIGTDVSGTGALGNGTIGLALVVTGNETVGGTTAAARNIISGNGSHGILIAGNTNAGDTIEGNFVGIGANGAALGNGGDGILLETTGGGLIPAHDNIIGGTALGAGNLISGNGGDGIRLTGNGTTGNLIQGNDIGTDVTGTAPLGNGGNGVHSDGTQNGLPYANVIGGATTGAGNLISANGKSGIYVEQGYGGDLIQGNYVGVNSAGSVALYNNDFDVAVYGAPGVVVGGSATGTGNVIGGSVSLAVSNNSIVQGNHIGTNATGTAVLRAAESAQRLRPQD